MGEKEKHNEENREAVKRETKHNQHQRSFTHGYRAVGTYMVTMVVNARDAYS